MLKITRIPCIFDQKGSVQVDMGAMAFIDSIEFSPLSSGDLPSKILVHPKRYLSNAPLLSTIDPFVLTVSSERGQKFDWVYTIQYAGVTIDYSGLNAIRFRLEILY
jgi:hypothetical protein